MKLEVATAYKEEGILEIKEECFLFLKKDVIAVKAFQN